MLEASRESAWPRLEAVRSAGLRGYMQFPLNQQLKYRRPLLELRQVIRSIKAWRTKVMLGLMSVLGPGCVKTCARRECAELFSPLSPVRLCCQCCSFPIQRNRDKISMCKFDVGVFTQPGPRSGHATVFRRRQLD